MNKMELADKIADKIGVSKNQVEQVLTSFVDITIETLKAGGEVTLTGFGAFSARQRKGREGINPRNPKEKIIIPSVVVAKFKAGKNLKDALKSPEKKRVEAEPVKEEPAESEPVAEPTVAENNESTE